MEKTIINLWKITIGKEIDFSNFIKKKTFDVCCDGDVIAHNLADIITCFKFVPPTKEMNNNFKSGLNKRVLDVVYDYWDKFNSE